MRVMIHRDDSRNKINADGNLKLAGVVTLTASAQASWSIVQKTASGVPYSIENSLTPLTQTLTHPVFGDAGMNSSNSTAEPVEMRVNLFTVTSKDHADLLYTLQRQLPLIPFNTYL